MGGHLKSAVNTCGQPPADGEWNDGGENGGFAENEKYSSAVHRSFRVVQLAKALGQKYVDAARKSVDARADIFGERDQQLGFAGQRDRGQIDHQQRRARETLARELYVAYNAEQRRRFLRGARRRCKSGLRPRKFKNRAADKIGYKVMACRKFNAILDGKKDVEVTKFLRVADGIYAFKMKDGLAAMILAEPTIFYGDGLRLGGRLRVGQEHLLQLGEPFGEIGQELGGQFALVAARSKDMRDGDEARIFSHS